MKDNFLITTGGSGGHVIPATIFCEHLSNKANIIISTDKRGLKYLDSKDYILEVIDTPKMNNIFLCYHKKKNNSQKWDTHRKSGTPTVGRVVLPHQEVGHPHPRSWYSHTGTPTQK